MSTWSFHQPSIQYNNGSIQKRKKKSYDNGGTLNGFVSDTLNWELWMREKW